MSEPVNITFSNGIDSLTTLNNVVSDEKSEYTDGILKFINSSYIYDISDDLTIDNYIVDKVLAEVVERGIHKFVLSDNMIVSDYKLLLKFAMKYNENLKRVYRYQKNIYEKQKLNMLQMKSDIQNRNYESLLSKSILSTKFGQIKAKSTYVYKSLKVMNDQLTRTKNFIGNLNILIEKREKAINDIKEKLAKLEEVMPILEQIISWGSLYSDTVMHLRMDLSDLTDKQTRELNEKKYQVSGELDSMYSQLTTLLKKINVFIVNDQNIVYKYDIYYSVLENNDTLLRITTSNKRKTISNISFLFTISFVKEAFTQTQLIDLLDNNTSQLDNLINHFKEYFTELTSDYNYLVHAVKTKYY